VTKLERHCRLLLKAYPAAYRRERAEEIVGLLLDVTPEGRNWPTGRDVRGLLAGGIRARAAIGQRPFSTVSYRTPVLVGIATFLATDAVADLRQSARFDYRMSWYWHWQGLITAPLILAAVVLAWLGCKRVYVFAAAWDAAVSLGYPRSWSAGSMTSLTRKRPLVQSQYRPPSFTRSAGHLSRQRSPVC